MDELKLVLLGHVIVIAGAATKLIVAWLQRLTRAQEVDEDGMEA